MTWIKTIDEDEATGTVKEFYDHWQGIEGTPTNIVKAHSLKPEIMTQWLALAGAVAFGGSSLGRRREELIAVLVPALLKCKYCTVAHARYLSEAEGSSTGEAIAIKEDYRSAGLGPEDMAMLEYAEKITLAPHTISKADLEGLRTHGFSDVQILEIASCGAYRNYIARVAHALGVPTDEAFFHDDPATRKTLEEGLV